MLLSLHVNRLNHCIVVETNESPLNLSGMGAVVDCKVYVKSRSLILGQKEGNVSDSLQLKLIILGLSNEK